MSAFPAPNVRGVPDGPPWGAWVRYGSGEPSSHDLEQAAAHCRVVVLQPARVGALRRLKELRPELIVLCYQCLASTRLHELGDERPTSGVGPDEAVARQFLARRPDGSLIEWRGFANHLQLEVWNVEYQAAWIENVVQRVVADGWDGVLADNDIHGDYYGIEPLGGGHTIDGLRRALDQLVTRAGTALNAVGKLFVPNIAESRRSPGLWHHHARFGGGFEETWLGHDPGAWFDARTYDLQQSEARGPGISVLRSPSGIDLRRAQVAALAAMWIAGGRATAAVTACDDSYTTAHFVPEQTWDLGPALGGIVSSGAVRCRRFARGWAALNWSATESVELYVPGVGPQELEPQSARLVAELDTPQPFFALKTEFGEPWRLVSARGTDDERYGEPARVALRADAAYAQSVWSDPLAESVRVEVSIRVLGGGASTEVVWSVESDGGDEEVAVVRGAKRLEVRHQRSGTTTVWTVDPPPDGPIALELRPRSIALVAGLAVPGSGQLEDSPTTIHEWTRRDGFVAPRVRCTAGHWDPSDPDADVLVSILVNQLIEVVPTSCAAGS